MGIGIRTIFNNGNGNSVTASIVPISAGMVIRPPQRSSLFIRFFGTFNIPAAGGLRFRMVCAPAPLAFRSVAVIDDPAALAAFVNILTNHATDNLYTPGGAGPVSLTYNVFWSANAILNPTITFSFAQQVSDPGTLFCNQGCSIEVTMQNSNEGAF
jgi:hypothetical protein